MRTFFFSLAILVLAPYQELGAQPAIDVAPGDRVRVTAPGCELKKARGTLVSLEGDVFSATLGNRDIECPVEALTRLDVSVGERKWWKASLLGTGIGAGVGGIGAIAITSSASEYDDMAGLAAFLFGLASTGAGLVTGTAIGLIRETDKWEGVPLPPVQPSVFLSVGDRLDIGFSIPLRR